MELKKGAPLERPRNHPDIQRTGQYHPDYPGNPRAGQRTRRTGGGRRFARRDRRRGQRYDKEEQEDSYSRTREKVRPRARVYRGVPLVDRERVRLCDRDGRGFLA